MSITGPETVTVEASDLVGADLAHTVFLDIRYSAKEGSKRAEYEAGHIPGAYFAGIREDLAAPASHGTGRNPLPDPDFLQVTLRKWGIDETKRVVVYGTTGSAARAWFVLRWAGLKNVYFLNGGLDAWIKAGGTVTTDEPEFTVGTYIVRPGSLPTLTLEEAAQWAQEGRLVDARGAATYSGEKREEGALDPAGHIPGALNVPNSKTFGAGVLLKSGDEIREAFASAGADLSKPIGLYCGGGVGATTQALALRSIGIEAPIFIGSWSAWTADPERPVAVGANPG